MASSSTTYPSIAKRRLMHRSLCVDREKAFHQTVLGAEFGDDQSVRNILPWVTVLFYPPNPEHTNTYNGCGGGELDVKTVLFRTAVVSETKEGSWETVVADLISGFDYEKLYRIIVEEIDTVHDFSNNEYDYCLPSLGHEDSKILGDMTENGELHGWDSPTMKEIETQRQNSADEEEDSSLALKEFENKEGPVIHRPDEQRSSIC